MNFRSALFTAPTTIVALAFLANCGDDAPNTPSTGGAPAAGTGATVAGTGGLAGAASGGGGTGGAHAGSGGAGAGGAATGGGGSAAGGSAGSGGGEVIPPTFATLKTIIQPGQYGCFGSNCHDDGAMPLILTVDDKLYGTLTTFQTPCGVVVKPSSPSESALLKVLKGEPCGDIPRMPFGKCVSDGDDGCVSAAYLAAITQWIQMGAPQQ